MVIGYIWGIVGDENVPMPITADDLRNHPYLICDMSEFETDMDKSDSSDAADKPF